MKDMFSTTPIIGTFSLLNMPIALTATFMATSWGVVTIKMPVIYAEQDTPAGQSSPLIHAPYSSPSSGASVSAGSSPDSPSASSSDSASPSSPDTSSAPVSER